jgi:hypothetical protein
MHIGICIRSIGQRGHRKSTCALMSSPSEPMLWASF